MSGNGKMPTELIDKFEKEFEINGTEYLIVIRLERKGTKFLVYGKLFENRGWFFGAWSDVTFWEHGNGSTRSKEEAKEKIENLIDKLHSRAKGREEIRDTELSVDVEVQ